MHIARYRIGADIVYGIAAPGGWQRLPGTPFDGLTPTARVDRAEDVTLLAPVESPRVFGVGLNYVQHIAEMKAKTPTLPMLFMKPPTAVVGPGAPVIYPREGKTVHFEAELAVVIGRRARRLSPEEAPHAVLGFTCANDISERVIQGAEMAQGCLLIGKGFDSFCPLGPVIATGLDPADRTIAARINGVRRQFAHTSDLLFSVPRLVSYLSQAITLLPGDVIITGTPSGVGPVQPGDRMEIEIDGIGVLANPVVAEDA